MSDKIEDIMGEPPSSLEEAAKRTIEMVNEHDPELFLQTESEFVALCHHGLGQHMRNYWGLWSQDSGVYQEINERFDLTHADDISGIILHAAYQTKYNLQVRLQEVADDFHRHWAEMKKMFPEMNE